MSEVVIKAIHACIGSSDFVLQMVPYFTPTANAESSYIPDLVHGAQSG